MFEYHKILIAMKISQSQNFGEFVSSWKGVDLLFSL